jgi:hypothetical protein
LRALLLDLVGDPVSRTTVKMNSEGCHLDRFSPGGGPCRYGR